MYREVLLNVNPTDMKTVKLLDSRRAVFMYVGGHFLHPQTEYRTCRTIVPISLSWTLQGSQVLKTGKSDISIGAQCCQIGDGEVSYQRLKMIVFGG